MASRINSEWKTMLRFTLAGFFLGTLGGLGLLVPNLDSRLAVPCFVFCPAFLLAMPLTPWLFEAAEVGTVGFYVLWIAAALANGILYLFVGAAWVGLRRPPGRPSS